MQSQGFDQQEVSQLVEAMKHVPRNIRRHYFRLGLHLGERFSPVSQDLSLGKSRIVARAESSKNLDVDDAL